MNFLEELEKLKVQAKDACAVWSSSPSTRRCSNCKWTSSFWKPAISWLNDLANCLVAQKGRPPSEGAPVRGFEVLSHSMPTSWRRGLLVHLLSPCHWSSTQRHRWLCSDVILFGKAWSRDGFMTTSNTSIFESPFDDRCDFLSNVVSQCKKNACPYICLMHLCICMVHDLRYVAWRLYSSKNI